MTSRTRIGRTAVLVAAATVLASGGTWAAASADPTAAPSQGIGVAGRTTSVGHCVGGGDLTLTTRPASRPHRVVVSATVDGVDDGTTWHGSIESSGGVVTTIGSLPAPAGSWTVTRTIRTPVTAPVLTSFRAGPRQRCDVDVKRRATALADSACSRFGSQIGLRVTDGPGGRNRVRALLESSAPARSRWALQISVDGGAGSVGVGSAATPLGRDGTDMIGVRTTLAGDATVTVTGLGRYRGDVVGRCSVSLGGRFTG